MSRLVVTGATGSLGRHVVGQALSAGHEVTVCVRTPSKLPPDVVERVSVHTGNLLDGLPVDVIRRQDALINCAGHVAEGQTFVNLIDRLVASVNSLSPADQPVCWFLAGAALLDIDSSGRRGVELPRLKSTYWAHRANFKRLSTSHIDWRLLCPGPMVDEPGLGLDRLRISRDSLPVQVSPWVRALPGALVLPLFGSLIPQMIVPYADAASLMLANLGRVNPYSHHRVGLALPLGTRGRKPQWGASRSTQ